MRLWMIALLVIVAGLLVGWNWSVSPGIPVEAALVRYASIDEFIDERGQTRLPQEYSITMPYEGRIAAIELIEGTLVKKGQALAQIVPAEIDLQLAAAEANVERLKASIRENDDVSVESTGVKQSLQYVQSMNRAVEAAQARVSASKAKLDYADKNLERVAKLRQSGAKSQDEYEQVQVNQVQGQVDYQQDVLVLRAMQALEAATALLPTALQQYITRKNLAHDVLVQQEAEAEANLDQVKRNQKLSQLVSPIDGVVLQRLVSDERRVTAGTELLRVGRLEDLQVEADVLSQDVVEVKPGNVVQLSGPAIGKMPAHGIVKRIYPEGFAKVSSLGVEQQRVKVVVGIDSSELARLRNERGLSVGYRVQVRIFTASRSHALVIPRSALFRGAAGDWQVFAIRDGRAELQQVQLGLMNDDAVEVIKGLKDAEAVVLAPETNLTAGTRAKPILREPLAEEKGSGDN